MTVRPPRRVPAAVGSLSLILALVAASASAQQRPEVGYVYPTGGRVGTEVEVQLGGYDWTPDMQFFVVDSGVELKVLGPPGEMLHPGPPHWFGPKARNRPFAVPREVKARFIIPGDTPPGPIRWQAANANGATSTGVFIVDDLPEVTEEDLALSRGRLPSLPLQLSGRLQAKEEIDRYQFKSSRSGPVTCSLSAARYGLPLHAVVRIEDGRGSLVADMVDAEGVGGKLTFPAIENQTYTLKIHDLDYRGNRGLLYRLSLREAPQVVTYLPPSGTPGTSQIVRFLGYGIVSGAAELESLERNVEFPMGPLDKPFTYLLKTPFGTSAPLPFVLSKTPSSLEAATSEGDDSAKKPSPLQLPCRHCGTLSVRNQVDQFAFTAVKGDAWRVSVNAQSFGSPLDVAFRILDSAGKKVAEADDAHSSSDASMLWNVRKDGDYRLLVFDRSGNTGRPTSAYEVCIEPAEADFEVSVAERLDVALGGEVSLPIKIAREGDLVGPIKIDVSGLPEGVTVPDNLEVPAGKSQLKVAVKASADGSSWASLATIRAVVHYEKTTIERTSRLLVAPTMKPRAVVAPLYRDAGRTVHRGATYAAPVVLERREDYSGPVTLQLASIPDRVRQGIRGDDQVVPPGVTQFEFPLFLPEWVQTDRTSRIILNTVVQAADPRGDVRHLVNKMEQRITMNVEGALLKLAAPTNEWNLRPGESTQVPVEISRSPKLRGSAKIEALDQNDESAIQVEPLVLAETESLGRLIVRCRKPIAGDELVVRLRATTLPRPDLPVISETELYFTTNDAP